jgi:hypothetical protein
MPCAHIRIPDGHEPVQMRANLDKTATALPFYENIMFRISCLRLQNGNAVAVLPTPGAEFGMGAVTG